MTDGMRYISNWPERKKTKSNDGKVYYAPFYCRWRSMRSRCYSKASGEYCRYGARGIKVCKEWNEDFWSFFDWCVEHYIDGYSIDRIDNNGDYTPENCRFASAAEQQQNFRMTPEKINATKKALAVLKKYPHLRTKGTTRCKVTGRFL